jgi:hypothetical protein
MPAGSFMNAPVAARGCGPGKAIAAYSAPMVQCRARRYRPSAPAKPERLIVVREQGHHDRRYRPGRATGSVARAPSWWPSGYRNSCWPVRACGSSYRYLDHRGYLNGRGLHPQCAALRTHVSSVNDDSTSTSALPRSGPIGEFGFDPEAEVCRPKPQLRRTMTVSPISKRIRSSPTSRGPE